MWDSSILTTPNHVQVVILRVNFLFTPYYFSIKNYITDPYSIPSRFVTKINRNTPNRAINNHVKIFLIIIPLR